MTEGVDDSQSPTGPNHALTRYLSTPPPPPTPPSSPTEEHLAFLWHAIDG